MGKRHKNILLALILALALVPVKNLNTKEFDVYHFMHLDDIAGAKRVKAASESRQNNGISSLQTLNGKNSLNVWVTAYSSTPEETDNSPFITASNKYVNDGIVAANFLPFGTKIKIPSLFGNKVFVVEDRMSEKRNNYIDIWMPSKEEAKKFGVHYTTIIIVDLANK